MKKSINKPHGIPWKISTCLEDVDFTNVICLRIQKESDIDEQLRLLNHYVGQVRIKLNSRNTKHLRAFSIDPE